MTRIGGMAHLVLLEDIAAHALRSLQRATQICLPRVTDGCSVALGCPEKSLLIYAIHWNHT